MSGEPISIRRVCEDLSIRSARAVVAQLAPRSQGLRAHLRERFEAMPGLKESFLADPVLEAAFPWRHAALRMEELSGGLLHPSVVEALDKPRRGFESERFPRTQYPYVHQLKSWESLAEEGVRGLLVSSGTGSGKTECFLVPIIDGLARQLDAAPLVGVQGLFIYPLNALINSQRDRLSAWLSPFGGKIRYCLYNGETPDDLPYSRQREMSEQVMTRRLLRSEPPPILITNATMLEYMLVRRKDAPILARSKGRLKWIVIDEAHTYVGSQAAELSLLLRRTMHAFGVSPADVQLIATSATISGGGAGDEARLAEFLAHLGGVDPRNVRVITGAREVPTLPTELTRQFEPLPSISELSEISEGARFEAVASCEATRAIREQLLGGPRTIGHLRSFLGAERATWKSMEDVLSLFDLLASARRDEEPFLPLRLHLFHRVQPGLWACCNPLCEGKRGTPLDDSSWPFGKVGFERRLTCPACESLMFELRLCSTCGEAYLSVELDRVQQRLRQALSQDRDDDFFETGLQDGAGEEADEEMEARGQGLLVGADFGGNAVVGFDPRTGKLTGQPLAGLAIQFPDDSGSRCQQCVTPARHARFRPAAVGAPFLLNSALPTLLEQLPAFDGAGGVLPSSGRRLLTFTDSRQGTAKFAVRAQYVSELNHGRSVILHTVLSTRQQVSPAEVAAQEATVIELQKHPALKGVLVQEQVKLEKMKAEAVGSKSWKDVADAIYGDGEVRQWLEPALREISFDDVNQEHVGQLLLFREFFRRPKRETSLETLGLVALEYPAIEALAIAPSRWAARGRTLAEWKELLTVILDHLFRARSAVKVPPQIERWMALPWRPTFILGPGGMKTGRNQSHWPSAVGSAPAAVVRMLAADLGLELSLLDDRRELEAILHDVWQQLQPMLSGSADGFQLDIRERVRLVEVRQAWRCPVTQRLIARTYRGLTPYGAWRTGVGKRWECERVDMPRIDQPWWLDKDGRSLSISERRAWLDSTEGVASLRDAGLWTDLSDRIVAVAPYYRVAEHSAQIDGAQLRSYEAAFKRGEINVLSCSTTMEMGVDIGGVSAVAMNNAPPSPANFLQRAGRAGRRGEAVTLSFTLCRSDPHGEAVFRKPTWPFDTPMFVPRVSLQSTRIVRRHLHSMLLAAFLLNEMDGDPPKLTTGWWFEASEDSESSPCEQFIGWCESGRAVSETELHGALRQLVKGSALARKSLEELVAEAGRMARATFDEWSRERDVLENEIERLREEGGEQAAGVRAATHQLNRMRAEYLLRELVSRNYLPGYGFPTSVVEFNTTTMRELKARAATQTREREDGASRRRGYPSRQLDLAIREYAPGNEVVIDGRVYRSEGVSLNWHRPTGVEAGRETQLVQTAWRCGACGETNVHPTSLDECPECGNADAETFRRHYYLQPSGFAVSIAARPTVKLDPDRYIPIELPWISCRKQQRWDDVEGRVPGRMRYSPEGHIFFRSMGLGRRGYVICQLCGRADSQLSDGTVPPGFTTHHRLRGGRDANGETICEGNQGNRYWNEIWLGASTETDVFELQLERGEAGLSRVQAYSIAVALRGAVSELLGIQTREIGCAAIPARDRNRRPTQSIVLFDAMSGGAGYVATAKDEIVPLLDAARSHLECPARCDSACQSCLLEYDTQYQAGLLSRAAALEVFR